MQGVDIPRDKIPPGTLYMLILRVLARSGKLHGFEIAKSIEALSKDAFERVMGAVTRVIQAT